jgi:hypothetical protein
MNRIYQALVFICSSITCSFTVAANCESYPFTDGINVEDVNGGTKIIATASASVFSDDTDSIKDARNEAILEAKSLISRFLNESIKSDEAVHRAVLETKSMQGNQKEGLRKEMVERVKKLQSSSQALLRGAVVIGDCYSRGREVRATIGIKPQSINSASKLKETTEEKSPAINHGSSESLATGKNPARPDSNDPPEYSNTEQLEKF